MWKWVRPLEEGKQRIRCSAVSENGEFPLPTPTSFAVSQVVLSPWWLSSSGHMSQAEALATRAWCGSGRNWGTEYFWAGGRGQSGESNPNMWGEQQGLRLMQRLWTTGEAQEPVEAEGGRKSQQNTKWVLLPAVPSPGKVSFEELLLLSYSLPSHAHWGRRTTIQMNGRLGDPLSFLSQ